MADIKQAAKWLTEGKAVRRAQFAMWRLSGTTPIEYAPLTLREDEREAAAFAAEDLLAEDWEVAE